MWQQIVQILCILLSAKNKSTLKESNGNKYFTLVVTDESKDTLKLCEELWEKNRDLIRSKTNSSDDYNKKCVDYI